MGGGFLLIAQRHAGVEGSGDERVSQRVRPDRLGDPGTVGYPADDPGSAVSVQPLSVWSEEDWPLHALADGQADRPRSGGARGW